MVFLPSRITVYALVLFGFAGSVYHFLPQRIARLLYLAAAGLIYRSAGAGRSRWSYFKLLVVIPCLSFMLLPGLTVRLLLAMCIALFRLASAPFSNADACYDLLQLPALLKISDSLALQKSQHCFNMHNMTRTDLQRLPTAFRDIYHGLDTYQNDIFLQCVKMKNAFSNLDSTPAKPDYYSTDSADLLAVMEAQSDLAAQCLWITGAYDDKVLQEMHMDTVALTEEHAKRIEPLLEMKASLKKLENVREMECDDGESESACRDRRVESLFAAGFINHTALLDHYRDRDRELNKTRAHSLVFPQGQAMNM